MSIRISAAPPQIQIAATPGVGEYAGTLTTIPGDVAAMPFGSATQGRGTQVSANAPGTVLVERAGLYRIALEASWHLAPGADQNAVPTSTSSRLILVSVCADSELTDVRLRSRISYLGNVSSRVLQPIEAGAVLRVAMLAEESVYANLSGDLDMTHTKLTYRLVVTPLLTI